MPTEYVCTVGTGMEISQLAKVCNYNRFLIKFNNVSCLFLLGITCPHLDDLSYGGVNVSDYYPDSRVHYYCNKGYKLVGDAYRVCLYSGYWNKEAPVCKRKSTSPRVALKRNNRTFSFSFSY